MENKYKIYKKLLDDLKNINLEKKSSNLTFMQVSGYPHFENVCSNILSFLFTTGEEHGFNDLFFHSLMELVLNNEAIPSDNVTVEREYSTIKKNRIYLVLISDNYIVGIENKIFSSVYNDLEDYKDTIDKLSISNQKEAKHIVLSLREEKEVSKSSGFINITYDNLFERIRANLGAFIEEANKHM